MARALSIYTSRLGCACRIFCFSPFGKLRIYILALAFRLVFLVVAGNKLPFFHTISHFFFFSANYLVLSTILKSPTYRTMTEKRWKKRKGRQTLPFLLPKVRTFSLAFRHRRHPRLLVAMKRETRKVFPFFIAALLLVALKLRER